MGEAWDRVKAGFDEPVEWAGWLMLLAGLVMAVTGVWSVYEALGLIAFGAITAFGARRYRGVRVGRDGLSIGGEDSPERLEDDS
jgi:hypothetical protein